MFSCSRLGAPRRHLGAARGFLKEPAYPATLEKSATAFGSARDAALASHAVSPKVNQALMQVERALTRPEGLRTRPWFRNLIFAADEDNGYANVQFPSVTEAIRSGDHALVDREIADLASRFNAAAHALDAQPFTPIDASNLTRVGTMRLRFASGTTGTMTYSVNGVSVTKAITRQVFSGPLPACS